MNVTEWYSPGIKPVRVGWFEAAIYDCGWLYEWRIWFDGRLWREGPSGEPLMNQWQTWRGMTTEQTA
jgi:hypothetical protein